MLQGTGIEFLTLYSILNGIFLLFMILLLSISGRIFEASKIGELKENVRILARVLSILMCLFIFLLQIPMITLLFQGYLCDEDPSLVVSSISCNSLEHNVLIFTSTILLIVYIVFLFVESIFYQSNSFDEGVPWSGFDRSLAAIKILIKIVISAGFAFDKAGKYRGQVNLVCFLIQAYITSKRFK